MNSLSSYNCYPRTAVPTATNDEHQNLAPLDFFLDSEVPPTSPTGPTAMAITNADLLAFQALASAAPLAQAQSWQSQKMETTAAKIAYWDREYQSLQQTNATRSTATSNTTTTATATTSVTATATTPMTATMSTTTTTTTTAVDATTPGASYLPNFDAAHGFSEADIQQIREFFELSAEEKTQLVEWNPNATEPDDLDWDYDLSDGTLFGTGDQCYYIASNYLLGQGREKSIHLGYDLHNRRNVAITKSDYKNIALNKLNPVQRLANHEIAQYNCKFAAEQGMEFNDVAGCFKTYNLVNQNTSRHGWQGVYTIHHRYAGDLQTLENRVRSFTPYNIANLIKSVGHFVQHLHDDRHSAHRDIKPDNIFLTIDEETQMPTAELGDLEFVSSDAHPEFSGTIAYISPSILRMDTAGERISLEEWKAGDVWALGVTWYLLTKGTPSWMNAYFTTEARSGKAAARRELEAYFASPNKYAQWHNECLNPHSRSCLTHWRANTPSDVQRLTLLSRMLDPRSETRIKMHELCQHLNRMRD